MCFVGNAPVRSDQIDGGKTVADGKKKKSGKKTGPDWGWILFIFVITMVISAAMSFISSRLLGNAGMAVSFLILICIVAIGIVFDIIGVAVTACPEAPFHAMASRKVAEAPDALKLLRNANRVSSFCNDVIGDICGVISGSAAAVIAARAVLGMESTKATIVTLGMSALVAAVTVGGKAVGKTFAMGGSVQVVRSTAKVLCFFRTIFQNKRRNTFQRRSAAADTGGAADALRGDPAVSGRARQPDGRTSGVESRDRGDDGRDRDGIRYAA